MQSPVLSNVPARDRAAVLRFLNTIIDRSVFSPVLARVVGLGTESGEEATAENVSGWVAQFQRKSWAKRVNAALASMIVRTLLAVTLLRRFGPLHWAAVVGDVSPDRINWSGVAEQRTPEWYRIRAECVSASDFATALSLNPYESSRALVQRKKTGVRKALDTFGRRAVAHGTVFEDVACSLFTSKHAGSGVDLTVRPCGFIVDLEYPWLGASPDGYIPGIDALIEIKCPLRGADGMFTTAYWAQMQLQMRVTQRRLCIFFQAHIDSARSEAWFLESAVPAAPGSASPYARALGSGAACGVAVFWYEDSGGGACVYRHVPGHVEVREQCARARALAAVHPGAEILYWLERDTRACVVTRDDVWLEGAIEAARGVAADAGLDTSDSAAKRRKTAPEPEASDGATDDADGSDSAAKRRKQDDGSGDYDLRALLRDSR